MAYWVDKKIDMILDFLREGRFMADLELLVEDLRICHDQAREFHDVFMHAPDRIELYRTRSSKILVAVGILKKALRGVEDKHTAYLDALEGVLLGVLRA